MAENDVYRTKIKQGKKFELSFTWHDDATPPVNYDVSGYSARLQIRSGPGSAIILHSSTDGAGITLGADEDWHIVWEIPTADTEAFDFNRAMADLEIVNPSGEVEESIRIELTLIKEVTI
jgi:hypothetical protein